MVYCSKCGHLNSDDATVCSNCGERLHRPARTGEREEYRPRSVRRSSDVCWEEEFRAPRGPGRGGLLVLGIGLIIVSLIVYTAIFSTEEFVAFWENFGRQLEEFFTSATFEQMAKLIGPVVLFLIGLAIILAAFRKK